MPINRQTCYVAQCDSCTEFYENGDGYLVHSATPSEAQEEAENGEWWFWQDRVWCENCVPPCKCGHLFGEHDYGEAPCEDCACPEYNPEYNPEYKPVEKDG